MAQTGGTVHGIQGIHQPVHPSSDLHVVLKKDSSVSPAQLFVKINPLPDIKAFIIIRNLISGVWIYIEQMLRNLQRPYRLIYPGLLLPVNEKLCSRTGHPANAVALSYLEEKGFIGHPRFHAADIIDFRLRHLK